MSSQLAYFLKDVRKIVGRNKFRYSVVWLSPVFWGLFRYRFDRQLYLIFGKYYQGFRLPLYPLFILLETWSKMDIHYKADIKGGIKVLHNVCGIVVSGQSVIGPNLILTGGNIIGAKGPGSIIIGEGVNFGANATLIGPLELGNQISIGAGACVVKSFKENGLRLVGVPANRIP